MLPVSGPFALTLLFTAVAIIVSEAASNTASANMIVPIAIAVAQAAGVDPCHPRARRDARREHGIHDAHLDTAERHRLQLRALPNKLMMRRGCARSLLDFLLITAMLLAFGGMLPFLRPFDVAQGRPELRAGGFCHLARHRALRFLPTVCFWVFAMPAAWDPEHRLQTRFYAFERLAGGQVVFLRQRCARFLHSLRLATSIA